MTLTQTIHRAVLATVACALLSACATPNALIESHAQPSGTNGYLGGLFSGQGVPSGRGVSSGFVFANQSNGKEYILPFFSSDMRKKYHEEAMRLIEVPPGTYKLTSWIRYDNWTGEIASKVPVEADGPDATFVVERSTITFVGRHSTSENEAGIRYIYRSAKKPVTLDEVRHQLAAQFPAFKNNLK